MSLTFPCALVRFLPALVLAGTCSSAGAQQLLEDINTDPPLGLGSDPAGFSTFGGRVYFHATTTATGRELFTSDGTAVGTTLLADLCAGPCSSPSAFLGEGRVPLGGQLYFTATTPAEGAELWKTDGTAAGTLLVRDLHTGTASSAPSELTLFDGALWFAGTVGPVNGGRQLFKTDGTASGTTLLGTSLPNSDPRLLTVSNGLLYFTGFDAEFGRELFVTDGTDANTLRLTDNAEVPVPPTALTDLNGTLLFTLRPAFQDHQLMATDGTRAGTTMILGGFEEPPIQLVRLGDQVFFVGEDSQGRELWSTDGTAAGTSLFLDLRPAGSSEVSGLTVVGDTLFFGADTGSRRQLWATDGSVGGTRQVTFSPVNLGTIDSGVGFQGEFYFTGQDGELWKSDGTIAGTGLVVDLAPGAVSAPLSLFSDGTSLWFSAEVRPTGRELYLTDGTAGGTRLVANLAADGGSSSSFPEAFATVPERAIFLATTEAEGRELWGSDGTPEGTRALGDLYPGPLSSDPEQALRYANGIVFEADTGTASLLAFTDGTPERTFLVPGNVVQPFNLYAAGTRLYFAAESGGTRELWTWTGGGDVARVVRSSAAGGPVLPSRFQSLGGVVLFQGEAGALGNELWISDGTEDGTRVLRDINPSGSSFPNELTPLGSELIFSAEGPEGRELWATDGTAAGTRLVKDIFAGGPPFNSSPIKLVRLGDQILFEGNIFGSRIFVTDGTAAGTEEIAQLSVDTWRVLDNLAVAFDQRASLWSTDGTAAGTHVLMSLPSNLDARHITVAGDRLYFALDTALYVTDGTPSGTAMLVDTDPLDEAPTFLGLTDVQAVGQGREVIFSTPVQFGDQLWKTDGTIPGTVKIADIDAVDHFQRAGGKLLFSAATGPEGVELHTLPLEEVGGYVLEVFGLGCTATSTGTAPRIRASGQPRLGEAFSLGFEAAPTMAVSFLYYAPHRFYFPVGDGCVWYLGSGLQSLPPINSGPLGEADYLITVPNDVGLLGDPIYCQMVIVDPGGPIGGIVTVSGAMEIIVGP